MNEEEMKERYMEYKQLDEQIKYVQKQVQMIENQLEEFSNVIYNLDEFNAVKKETEILVPLSSGIFAKGKIQDTSEFLVNVGSNVIVQKDLQSTKKLIQTQISEMRNVQERMIAELQELVNRASKIEKELENV